MDYCSPQPLRRHNPVDSICRKLQTIQRHGDREPNSPFQIPKLSSSCYDSPQQGLRHNLDAILKKRPPHRLEVEAGEMGEVGGESRGTLSPTASPRNLNKNFGPLTATPVTPFYTPFTPAAEPPAAANVTFTITSTLGEKWGGGGPAGGLGQGRPWHRSCSTPAAHTTNYPSSSSRFTFSRGSQMSQPEDGRPQSRSPPLPSSKGHSMVSYNLNFCSADSGSPLDCELPYPALVVKRLSMGDGGSALASEAKKETMAEVSLICEEDLLDSIFHACDTQRRGKVYVSRIVDYLRHTTSRSSEDSGLDELCNMLDPEHKDISIDLDTYHAIMREWIDDCRNNGEEPADEPTQESIKAKRSMLLNMTSGSLEAFGGDVSRADLETSELMYCVTDLQLSNQKLQEEVRKLKSAVESMEETNQKLAEDNEELRTQARVSQQLAQKEKILKEEVEEMKATLTCTEEGRARASAHSKHVERENQSLIAKIASLQEENLRVSIEMDDLQKKMVDLCDLNTDLQVQIHSFDTVLSGKDAVLLEKSRQIEELKAAVEEYLSVTELLRADKNKLETQMQMMQPDLAAAGLPLSVAYRFNQMSSGSLQTELALAQTPLEGVERLSSSLIFASPLDETLDKEVLLLLQGPSPDYLSLEFRSHLDKLKSCFVKDAVSLSCTLKSLLDDHSQPESSTDDRLHAVLGELEARRAEWALDLDQLGQYTDSLEKELIKMAGNMRRSRTEILHLSVRVQEQENHKRQLCEELDQLKTSQDGREASCQNPDPPEQEPGEDLDWDEEFAFQDFLKNELEQRNNKETDGWRERRLNGVTEAHMVRGERETGQREEERCVKVGGGEEEEEWCAVVGGGEEEVKASTPLQPDADEAPPCLQSTETEGQDFAHCPNPTEEVVCRLPQEEDMPEDAHSQAASVGLEETNSPSDSAHTENIENINCSESSPDASAQDLSISQDETIIPASTPPRQEQMVPSNSTSPVPGETIPQSEGSKPVGGAGGQEGSGGGEEADSSGRGMNMMKGPSQDKVSENSTSLLPVLEEEEEGAQNPDQPSSRQVPMAGTDRLAREGLAILCDSSPPQPAIGPSSTSQSEATTEGTATACSQSEGLISAPEGSPEVKKDATSQRSKFKKELDISRSMEVIAEHMVKEDLSESSTRIEKEAETSVFSEPDDSRDDRNSLSPNDKEIETEFQRLSLGFKCDMFTLEKRLRLEERSRDLAEENVRREVSSCQGLLQALIPLCEDDNQSMEIILRLQKNLEILIQSMTRVSSRSEMLGAIHQESRIGKAVEVMIQHVENLRRMYTTEHAELLGLRETMKQSERSFGTERDDFRPMKSTGSYSNKSVRRVSIAAIPRSGGSSMYFDMPKTQNGTDGEAELTRRSRCPSPSPSPTVSDSAIAPCLAQSLSSSRAAVAARGSRGVWLWLAIVVILAGLLALLASLVMQPAVDAAPVGTADSWMTLQQVLWPYTGLRHNGQPPV